MRARSYRTARLVVLCLGALLLMSCSAAMSGLEVASIEIKAPPEKVFNYVSDPANWKGTYEPIKSVSNIQGQGLGQTFDWTTEWKNIRGQGHAVVTVFEPNRKFVAESTCGKTITYILTPTPDGTKLTLSVRHAEELPVGGKPVKQYVLKELRKSFDNMLSNVKTAVEK